eukprot:GHVU01142561.1.p1 GENE.GHVU01142561.1~~GHVU01142561.1.p1  ORF type:complete len:144 (+),score=5.61 GHVU01142561.1:886-1317(+)
MRCVDPPEAGLMREHHIACCDYLNVEPDGIAEVGECPHLLNSIRFLPFVFLSLCSSITQETSQPFPSGFTGALIIIPTPDRSPFVSSAVPHSHGGDLANALTRARVNPRGLHPHVYIAATYVVQTHNVSRVMALIEAYVGEFG